MKNETYKVIVNNECIMETENLFIALTQITNGGYILVNETGEHLDYSNVLMSE